MGGALVTLLALVVVAACAWEDRESVSIIIDGIRRK